MRQPIFRSAITDENGDVDVGYLSLMWGLVGWGVALSVVLCIGVRSAWTQPESSADVVKAIGDSIIGISAGFAAMLGAEKTLVQKSGYYSRSAASNEYDLALITEMADLAVDAALRGEAGVIGHDEEAGDELRAVEFARIKGGKPFDIDLPWYRDLLADIGQPAPVAAPPAATPGPGRQPKGEHYSDRIRESARHEAAKAEMAELELAQRKSQLTDVEGVQKAMADFATLTRQTYERIRPELKLRLAVETDPDRVDQLLRDAIDNAARTVADLLKAQIDAAANTRQ